MIINELFCCDVVDIVLFIVNITYSNMIYRICIIRVFSVIYIIISRKMRLRFRYGGMER